MKHDGNDLPPTDERVIAVRLRDHDQCTVCNRTESLEVHQIVPDDKGAEKKLANYILLCEDHHQKAHREQEAQ